METAWPNFLQSLPASKLFPPRFGTELPLPRSRVPRFVRERGGAGRKALLVEAQAGQGTSIFAAQLVEHLGADWL